MQLSLGRTYLEEDNDLSLQEVVNLIKADIDDGMFYVLKWNLESLLKRNLLIHLDSINAYNFYKK